VVRNCTSIPSPQIMIVIAPELRLENVCTFINSSMVDASPAATVPPDSADIMMITGRMNFMERDPMIKPVSVARKNWMSPLKGSRAAAAKKASIKHRMKMPAT